MGYEVQVVERKDALLVEPRIGPHRVGTVVSRGLAVACVLSILFVLSGCTVARRTAFVPFDAHQKITATAQAKDFEDAKGVQVESEAAFNDMKAHVAMMYKGTHVKHTFVGDDGHHVDCIPIDQQPGLKGPGMGGRKVQLKPSFSASKIRFEDGRRQPPGKDLDIRLRRGEKDKFGNEQFCPEGTIPMGRLTLEEMTRFKTLNHFFSKGGDDAGGHEPPDPRRGDEQVSAPQAATSVTHYYGAGRQQVDNFGGDSWLNVWSPTTATNRMSLSQQWYSAGSGNSTQTVEGGWQAYPNKYGGNNSRLFIYYTTAGYSSGSGCYNLECPGFVQINNSVYLAGGFTHYSSTGGTQWGFNMQWQRASDGNWWLFYKGGSSYIAVGYYPKSLYGSGQMSKNATRVTYGGECTGKPSAKQMGSGANASQGWQKAAFQNKIFYIDTSTTGVWADLYKIEPTPSCYSVDIHNIYGNWGTYCYFGGSSCN